MAEATGINPNPKLVSRATRPRDADAISRKSKINLPRFGLFSDLPEDFGCTRDVFALGAGYHDDEDEEENMDEWEIFEHVRDVMDPEHPHTLEALGVVSVDKIKLDSDGKCVEVQFAPTVPHCSMATLIGLSLRVKLDRVLPKHCKRDVVVFPGSHASEEALNKQLADKERVAAALENPKLREMVDQCLASSE